jgi:hypothetical protein
MPELGAFAEAMQHMCILERLVANHSYQQQGSGITIDGIQIAVL